MTEPDVIAVRKAVQAHELVPVETTLLTKRPAVGFKHAEDKGFLCAEKMKMKCFARIRTADTSLNQNKPFV